MHPAHEAAADFLARRDREQRRHYARKPKKIADVLAQLITARGYGRIQAAADFTAAWQQAAGETIAKYTRPGRLRRGTLEVTVAQLDDHPRTHLPKTTNPHPTTNRTARRQDPRHPLPRRQHLITNTNTFTTETQRSQRKMTMPDRNDQAVDWSLILVIAIPLCDLCVLCGKSNQSKANRTRWLTNPKTINPKRSRLPRARPATTPPRISSISRDLEHVRERPSHVHRRHHAARPAPPRLRSRRQLDRRSDGRPRHARSASRSTSTARVTVEDDGRGIPVERHAQLSEEAGRDMSTLEGVMTVLKFGGKFDKGAYQTSGGLHGVGVTVVNFLSEWCEVEVCRDGQVYQQEYERGIPKAEVRRVGNTDQARHEDHVQARSANLPEHEVRLRHAPEAHAGAGLPQPAACASRSPTTAPAKAKRSSTSDGLREFVEHLNRASEPVHADVIYVNGESEGVSVEVALQYSAEYTENVHSYVNNINTTEGGTHLSGFRTALTRCINNYGKKTAASSKTSSPRAKTSAKASPPSSAAACPIRSSKARPKPSSATAKSKASSTALFGEYLNKFLEENPKAAKAIGNKGLLAAEARDAARKAERAHPRTQRRPLRRRPARQAPRLHQPRRRQVRAVPGRR